ncbi:DUF998 domain-containing protein [Devosia sp. Root635]|uniref:DUF998 domain-containing protein n=1 Tax=Devosia sp. Root635 TaxID=1736575 RepID=UPI0006F51498|nr:DUF998 domain-containing protein [Devosia sp. Root635]KRA48333.1 hypothetical protein ASD80_17495 [Devosia sp. Root635]
MTSQFRLGAIFWVLTAEFFIAQFIAQAVYPGYSLAEMDISLLGVTDCNTTVTGYGCSPRHLVFNGGMVLAGLLIMLGAWLTRRLWPSGPLTVAALCLLAVGSGLGDILVGIFPVDVFLEGHLAGAVLTLFVACLGILLLGSVLWRSHRAFALYSIATGLVSLAMFGCYMLEFYLGLGRGVIERIGAWSHNLWYVVAGVLILAGHFGKADNPGQRPSVS